MVHCAEEPSLAFGFGMFKDDGRVWGLQQTVQANHDEAAIRTSLRNGGSDEAVSSQSQQTTLDLRSFLRSALNG